MLASGLRPWFSDTWRQHCCSQASTRASPPAIAAVLRALFVLTNVFNRVSAALPRDELYLTIPQHHSGVDPMTGFWPLDPHGSSQVGASFGVHPENQ
jgi:hypothetical protein